MQLALGDALAIALLESRGFTAIDFRRAASGRPARRDAQVRARHHAHRRSDAAGAARHADVGGAGRDDGARASAASASSMPTAACVGIITDGDLRRHMRPDLLADRRSSGHDPRPEDGRPGSARERSARDAQLVEDHALIVVEDEQAGRHRARARSAARRRGLTVNRAQRRPPPTSVGAVRARDLDAAARPGSPAR